MERILLNVFAFVFTISCVFACGENSNSVYNVRQRRDKLSENVVIGMDYMGKPKIVCHCDAGGLQTLRSKIASRRNHVITVKPQALNKTNVHENSSKNGDQGLQRDLVYSPTCCKIDLADPKKLYSYPFTIKLSKQTFSDVLTNKSSEAYRQLEKQLIDGLTSALTNEGCVVNIRVTAFRKGSVLADVMLTVQGLISQSIIETLKSSIGSGNIGGLEVEIVPEPPPEPPAPTQTPTQPSNKTTPKPTEASTEENPSDTESSDPEKVKTHADDPPSSTSDTGGTDTGATDTGATDTGATDTGATDTGATDTGTTDTGATSSTSPMATVSPSGTTPAPTTPAPTPSTTPAPPKPKLPTDSRSTEMYNPNTPAKEFKVDIILTDKIFDGNLNRPSTFQYLELKKVIEESLTDIFKANAEFVSVTVQSFTPVSPPSAAKAVVRRSSVLLKGVEVTLDFKFKVARPSLLVPLETQLKLGEIASHSVAPDMAAVSIKDESTNGSNGLGGSNGKCSNTCRQPSVCAPACSTTCCSPPATPCPSPCSSRCAPSCTSSCCTLTK